MAEQRFGIFGKDVTRYIPPELRPFTKLAVDMNPVTGFQRAGQALKEGDYGESALETGILALPAGAYALRNVIKPSVTAGVDALKELFLLGGADDVVKKTPAKKGVSRRDVLAGMGATVLVPPVLKEAGEVLPVAKAGKVAKTVLKGGPLAQARALDSDISRIFVNSIRPNRNITKPVRAAELKEQDIKTIEMNKILHNFMKDKSYDDLMKMDRQDLIELFNIKYKTHHAVSDGVDDAAYRIKFGASAGDPLRSERNGPLLDRVFKDRGLDPPTFGVPKNYEGPPPLGYRPEAYPNIKQKPRTEYEYDFLNVDTTQGFKDLNLDMPSSIIPKMLPSNVQEDLYPLGPRNFKKEETAYHFTFPEKIPGYQDKFKKLDIKQFDLDVAEARNKGYSEKYADILGIHVGSDKAARDRFYSVTGKTDERGTALEEKGQTYPLKIDTSKPFLNPNSIDGSGLWSETELENYLFDEFFKDEKFRDIIEDNLSGGGFTYPVGAQAERGRELTKVFRKKLAEDGFTNIPYLNDVEGVVRDRFGNIFEQEISHIMLIDRPDKSKVIKSSLTGEPMAEGGVAGLSDIARDMFKGPKGIGAYQPFMVG